MPTGGAGINRMSELGRCMSRYNMARYCKLRTTVRQDPRQPLRRCRATSPCRGGFSCRENVSAVVQRHAWAHVKTHAKPSAPQPPPGVARASRPWTIMLLQQSAFLQLCMDARQDPRQPLRRWRATSPCRGGFSCRENVSAVVQRHAWAHVKTHAKPSAPQPPPGVARASRPWTIMLLQQSAFLQLCMDARQDPRQPLRRWRATSPCRWSLGHLPV